MNIEKILLLIATTAIFTVTIIPLVVVDGLFFPFVTGKAFLFRILIEIAFFSWLLLIAFGSIPRPKITPIRLAIGVFVAVVAVANIFGVAPYKSFWSNFERMEGMITVLYLLAYFVVAGSILKTQQQWQRFWSISLGVSAVIGLLAMGDLAENGFGMRTATTLGNPIYLAIYMVFHMFIAGLLYVRAHTSLHKVILGILIIFQGLVLYSTGTRGTLLALLGGVFVTALSLLFFARSEEYKRIRKIAFSGIVAIVLLVGGFITVKDTVFVTDSHVLSRFAHISLTEGTSMARLTVWNIAWQGVKERPLLGWGQENFSYVFNTYYNPKMHAQELWFDRTHNVMMDWLIAAGVLGLLAYISMYFAVLYEVWRSKKFNDIETSIIIGLLAAYGIHNLFVFDNLISYIMFFSLAAWLHASHVEEVGCDKKVSWHITEKYKRFLIFFMTAVVALGFVYAVNIKAYTQNKILIRALSASARPATLSNSLEYFTQALSYNTYGTQEVSEHLMKVATRVAQSNMVDAEIKNKFFILADVALREQQKKYPQDVRSYVFAGVLLSAYGKYDEALVELRKAHTLSPKKQAILYQLGANALDRAQYNEALEYFKTAYELDTTNTRALILYATAYIYADDLDSADVLLQTISPNGIIDSPTLLNVYSQKKIYSRVVQIWKLRIEKRPRDANAYFALAATYALMGDKQHAIESAHHAAELNSKLDIQVREFIKNLK